MPRECVDFSLKCAWLLEAYSFSHKKKSQGSRLKTLILSGDLVPAKRKTETRTAWKTSFRGQKCPAVTPKPPVDLLTAPRPHEFHTQVRRQREVNCSRCRFTPSKKAMDNCEGWVALEEKEEKGREGRSRQMHIDNSMPLYIESV